VREDSPDHERDTYCQEQDPRRHEHDSHCQPEPDNDQHEPDDNGRDVSENMQSNLQQLSSPSRHGSRSLSER
jgi:hypothetical protein